jgi:hypothetical protein
MKMGKILKGVFVYTFIILGILLVAGMFVIGIMFITSTSDKPLTVFGYRAMYLSNVHREDIGVTGVSTLGIASELTVKINGADFNVEIVEADNALAKHIVIKKIDYVFGLYKGDYVPEATASYDTENKIVTINVSTPEGLMSYNKSKLIVSLPTVKNFSYNFDINTKGGDVFINGALAEDANHFTTIKDLTVKTISGDFTAQRIGAKTTATADARFSDLEAVLRTINLKTDRGVFDLSNIKTLKLSSPSESNKIEIEANRGDFIFNDIEGPMDIKGEDIKIVAKHIDTKNFGFTFNSPKGYFDIDKITTENAINTIDTRAINVKINEISGQTSIKTTYGNITVGTLKDISNLESENGNITVASAEQNLSAFSQFGDITVTAYKSAIHLKNNKGKITATYEGDTSNAARQTKVEAVTGSVELNKIYNSLNLITTGSAKVTVDFEIFPEQGGVSHIINIHNGEARLKLGATIPFYLEASGNVSGTVATQTINSSVTQFGNPTQGAHPTITANAGSGKIVFETKI